MSRHVHKFQRLSDEAIFCDCGEIRQLPKPPYVPVPNITIDPVRLPDPWIGPNTWPRWVPNTTTIDYPNDSRMTVMNVSSAALHAMRSMTRTS